MTPHEHLHLLPHPPRVAGGAEVEVTLRGRALLRLLSLPAVDALAEAEAEGAAVATVAVSVSGVEAFVASVGIGTTF